MQSSQSGIISWFAKNPVAANLVMLFIVVAGAISASSISKDMFPRSDIPIIGLVHPIQVRRRLRLRRPLSCQWNQR
jgi:hypothetical protein